MGIEPIHLRKCATVTPLSHAGQNYSTPRKERKGIRKYIVPCGDECGN